MLSLRAATVSLVVASLAAVTGCAGASSASTETADLTAAAPTDAAIQATLEAAAKGLTYTSESDYPWTYVSARGDVGHPGALTTDDVKKLFASYVDDEHSDGDKPMASLKAESRGFAAWTGDDAECTEDDGPECAQTQQLYAALGANLSDIRVYLFGAEGKDDAVQGTAVSIFLVGRTPRGTWAGVRTIAIWT